MTLTVAVAAIAGRPGESRRHRTTVPADELALAGEISVGPVEVDVELDGVVEGVMVHGRLAFELTRPCARCLTDIRQAHDVAVAEMFFDPQRRDPADEDDPGYDLREDSAELDLTALLHDSVLIDQPVRTLCRPDCAGLCVACGVDRNHETCDCDTAAPADPRWAALADVQLESDPT